jgi:hypothetical protein
LREKVALAVEEARLASKEPFNLFPTEPVVDIVMPTLKRTPQPYHWQPRKSFWIAIMLLC